MKRVLIDQKILTLPALLLTTTLTASCTKDTLDVVLVNPDIPKNHCSVFTNDYTPNPNDTTSVCLSWNHPALTVMRERAERFGNIKWKPLGEVPTRSGTFRQGEEVKGIPYSSVKEFDKFVGQEVSFYTFITAVNNPRSVIYSENVSKPPYKGINCATYYGSVCSMTVNYALGLDRPYQTSMYGTLPFIKRVAQQDIEHIAPGDLIHFLYGHVILITNIVKNSNDSIQYVHYLECTGRTAFNEKYTKQQLQNRLDKHDHVIYRYTDIKRLASESSLYPDKEANADEDLTKAALCLSRGDRVTYNEDEGVVIVNVLEEGYDRLIVYKSENGTDAIIKDICVDGTPNIELTGLRPGSYKASLTRVDGADSETVSFEILQTKVSVSFLHDNIIDIRFASMNAMPEYVVFCNENGGRSFIDDITEEERQSGHKLVKCEASLNNLYLKVFFRGEYGRSSNAIIPLKNDFATNN